MKSPISYKFRVVSRLLIQSCIPTEMIALLIMIMHDILIHFYFLKASITFHSSNCPTPSHSNQISC